MSLGTGIEIPNNFDLNSPLPLDSRYLADTLVDRDAIPSVARHEGMQVYVGEDQTLYILKGGVDNTDWTESGMIVMNRLMLCNYQ